MEEKTKFVTVQFADGFIARIPEEKYISTAEENHESEREK